MKGQRDKSSRACGRRGHLLLKTFSFSLGRWVAESVKRVTLGFGSDRNLGVLELSPILEILFPAPSAPPSLKRKEEKEKKKTQTFGKDGSE